MTTTPFPVFRTPTLDTCFQIIRAHTHVVLPDADTSDGSDYWRVGRLVAAASWQLYGPIQYTGRQLFPETADEEHLVRHGRQLRITRKGTSAAAGFALMTGMVGSSQGSLSTAQSLTGTIVQTTSAATLAVAPWAAGKQVVWFNFNQPNYFIVDDVTGLAVGDVFELGGLLFAIKDLPGGNAVFVYGRIPGDPRRLTMTPKAGFVIPIAATSDGANGNLEYGSPLTLDSPGVDIDPQLQVLELSGGADLEALDAWAIRMGDVRTEYPAGGNRSQVLMWMKETAGVDRAWLYARFRGLGTDDGVPQGVRRARHLSMARQAVIQNRLAPAVPTVNNPGLVAPGIDFKITDWSELPVEFQVYLEPQPGYGPDWTGFFIIGGTPTVDRIPTTTSAVGTIVPGNRIAVRVGTFSDLVVATVQSVDGAGLNINPALPDLPTPGDYVMPGGPLTEPAATALEDLVDSLGPGDTIPTSRFPPPSADAPGKMPLSRVIAVLQDLPGVGKVAVALPGTDVIPFGKVQVTISKITIFFQ